MKFISLKEVPKYHESHWVHDLIFYFDKKFLFALLCKCVMGKISSNYDGRTINEKVPRHHQDEERLRNGFMLVWLMLWLCNTLTQHFLYEDLWASVGPFSQSCVIKVWSQIWTKSYSKSFLQLRVISQAFKKNFIWEISCKH